MSSQKNESYINVSPHDLGYLYQLVYHGSWSLLTLGLQTRVISSCEFILTNSLLTIRVIVIFLSKLWWIVMMRTSIMGTSCIIDHGGHYPNSRCQPNGRLSLTCDPFPTFFNGWGLLGLTKCACKVIGCCRKWALLWSQFCYLLRLEKSVVQWVGLTKFLRSYPLLRPCPPLILQFHKSL